MDIEEKVSDIVAEGYRTSESLGEGVLLVAAAVFFSLLGNKETSGKVFHLLERVLTMPGVIPLVRSGMALIGPDTMDGVAG